jgi:hypothetical protein
MHTTHSCTPPCTLLTLARHHAHSSLLHATMHTPHSCTPPSTLLTLARHQAHSSRPTALYLTSPCTHPLRLCGGHNSDKTQPYTLTPILHAGAGGHSSDHNDRNWRVRVLAGAKLGSAGCMGQRSSAIETGPAGCNRISPLSMKVQLP